MTTLADPPKFLRASISRGTETESPVERTGGMFGAGLIRGVSLITVGEALGHDMWIDSEFVESVTEAVNASRAESGGVKARFTHPGLSSDGMGKHLGRLKDARTVGNQSFADLHLQEASHNTPDGDLADYVMSLAEETPEAFGLSIVFERDDQAMRSHREANDGEDGFQSPDEKNTNNFVHARMAKLRAGDVVDEPAANPSGLFSATDVPAQADAVLSYVLGLSESSPGSIGGIDAERMSGFVARFLDRHNLEVKGKTMPDENVEEVDREKLQTETRTELKAEADRYFKAFGQNGTGWFFEGLSFEAAQTRHIECLEKELLQRDEQIKELQGKLDAIDLGDDKGADVDSGDAPKKRTFAQHTRGVSDN